MSDEKFVVLGSAKMDEKAFSGQMQALTTCAEDCFKRKNYALLVQRINQLLKILTPVGPPGGHAPQPTRAQVEQLKGLDKFLNGVMEKAKAAGINIDIDAHCRQLALCRLNIRQLLPSPVKLAIPAESKSEYDQPIKVVVFGDQGAGKTSLFERVCKGKFPFPSSLPDDGYGSYTIDSIAPKPNGEEVRVRWEIWISPGKPKAGLDTSKVRGAHVIFLPYDCGDLKSYYFAKYHAKQALRDDADKSYTMVLASTKIDEGGKLVVNPEEARKFAIEQGLLFFETSAKSGLCKSLAGQQCSLDDMLRTTAQAVLAQRYPVQKQPEESSAPAAPLRQDKGCAIL